MKNYQADYAVPSIPKLKCSDQLEMQRLVAEAVIKITEKERTRLGQELHDNVNQLLACSVLFLDTINPTEASEVDAKHKSRELLLTAIEEIRKLSKALVMPQLSGPELITSIHTLARDVEQASKLKIRFSHDLCDIKISSGKRLTIYRILQEQLRNILKHSKANQVFVSLTSTTRNIQLIIEDDGIGCSGEQEVTGIGLTNIRDRVRFYGGLVEISSAPGTGFKMTVSLPRKKPVKEKNFSVN